MRFLGGEGKLWSLYSRLRLRRLSQRLSNKVSYEAVEVGLILARNFKLRSTQPRRASLAQNLFWVRLSNKLGLASC